MIFGFGSNTSPAIHGVSSTTYEPEMTSTRIHSLRKSIKITNKVSSLKISISIVVYKDS